MKGGRHSDKEHQGAPKNKGSKAKKVQKVTRGASKPPKSLGKKTKGTKFY